MDYLKFLEDKEFRHVSSGFDVGTLDYPLFDYQEPIVRWALRRGKAAIFADTGLGKTIMQLAWACEVNKYSDSPVLILAPLAVSNQTINEGKKYGIEISKANPEKIINGLQIINYEQIHKFNFNDFSGIVLDESSILKGMDGRRRKEITEFAKQIPYRLSCTATPSPNDFMEIGTQCEFLGVMSQIEMLAMFFVNDMSDTGKWRLKGHGHSKFFEWMATWSIVIRKPSDLGYDDSNHDLTPIIYHNHVIETTPIDALLVEQAKGLQERNKARKDSVDERVELASKIANSIDGPVLVWCNLNDESQKLTSLILDAVEVKGSDKHEHKEKSLLGFSSGSVRVLVTKPKIAGFGMNWQNCNNMIFVGLSDSWESYYQAIRRCWRFGQTKDVHVHIISADTEGAVVDNIKRKDDQNKLLGEQMIKWMKTVMEKEIFSASTEKTEYTANIKMEIPKWLK